MYLIWGLFSTFLALLLELILMQVPFSLHRQSMSFFIPMGGIIEGALCAAGVYLYVKVKRIKLKPKHFICGVLVALTGFWSIYFMNYKTAYVYNDYINNSFKGEKLSDYMNRQNVEFTFSDYLNLVIDSTTFKSAVAGGTIIEDHKFGHAFNSTVIVSEGAGFCVGGLLMCVIALRNKGNCKKCRAPYNTKKIYIFKPEYLESEINEVQTHLRSKADFKEFVYKDRELVRDNEAYVEVFLKYCSNCNIASLEYKHMKAVIKDNKDTRWVEDESKYREVCLNEEEYIIATGTSL